MDFHACSWPPPHKLHNRYSPSIILYLPYCSGGWSVRRIIARLIADQYQLCETDLKVWSGVGKADTYNLEETGYIYVFFNPKQMKKAILDSGLRLEGMTYLVCLRDPRDLLVSLYFLAQDSTHIAMAEGTPIHEQMLIAAQKTAATPIDEYVLNSVASFRQLMEDLQYILAEIPSQKIRHLSYAALCQAFPQYLAGLIDVLGVQPTRHTIADILYTEDIQRPKTLHRDSLAHFPKASPTPGRHKRDLKPDSVKRLYQEFAPTLAWMADNDLPEFRELYT